MALFAPRLASVPLLPVILQLAPVILQLALLIVILSACAPELLLTATRLDEGNGLQGEQVLALTEDVDIALPSGYSRQLKKGTKWRFVGTIEQGKIFRGCLGTC